MSHLEEKKFDTNKENDYSLLWNFDDEIPKGISKEELKKRQLDSTKIISAVNQAFFRREQPNPIMNNYTLSQAYVYNYRKATNYVPDLGNDDDNNLSTGHIHEVIFTLMAILLGLDYKSIIKCRDEKGNEDRELALVYEKLIKYSLDLENFKEMLPYIINESLTQGDCFLMESWEIKESIIKIPSKIKGNKETEINKNNIIDYNDKLLTDISFIEKIKFEEKKITNRAARFIKLDGRNVIEGNPEIEDAQKQPFLFIETLMTMEEAESQFSRLTLWEIAKKCAGSDIIQYLFGKPTIYNESRLRDSKDLFYVHYYFNKEENRYNLFINGIMMYDYNTPMNIFFPAMKYPIVKFSSEINSSSFRSKSIPMKLKYVSDYLDFFLNTVAFQRYSAVIPAINVTGRRTISANMFKGGSVNHGIELGKDYHFADDQVFKRALQSGEVEWINKIQEIMQNQSLNSITLGQSTEGQLATGIIASQQNQIVRLKPIVYSFLRGMCDLYSMRADTIKYKYSIPTSIDEVESTIEDGEKTEDKKNKKTKNVYQEIEYTEKDYQLNILIDDLKNYGEVKEKDNELFQKSFNDKLLGKNKDYVILDAENMKFHNITVDGEFNENLNREQQLQKLYQDIQTISSIFPNADRTELEKRFLSLTDYPENFFKKLYEAPINNTANIQSAGASDLGNTPSGLAYSVNSKKPI